MTLVFSNATALAAHIAGLCEKATPNGTGWKACCPAHEDSTPSLSITPDEAQEQVLLHCFANCTTEAIVPRLMMEMADLFVGSRARKPKGRGRTIDKTYDYIDLAGAIRHQTIRYLPKKFSQRRPDPHQQGVWIENVKGVDMILYHLPDLAPAIARGAPIFITEGEKDVESLRALGLVATCSAMGADGLRRSMPAYTATLQGADCYLLPDHDEPGLGYMQRIAAVLKDVARSVRIVPGIHTEAAKSDVTDWIAAGGTRPALEAAAEQAPPWQGPTTPPVSASPAGTSAPVNPDTLFTDNYNARALVQAYGPRLRYCYLWKCWLVWTGTHWQRDTSGQVMRWAKVTIKAMAAQIVDLEDPWAKALLIHIKKSLSTAALKATVEQARDEEGVSVQPEELDRDPWLLNCTNGTLDLRTGALRPHQPTDLVTMCLDIPYTPAAPCPEWQKFLWRIMGGTVTPDDPDMSVGELEQRHTADTQAQEMIDFLQRAIGYSLTGSNREQCLFILHGITKTGKSTFLAVLRKLLGPYGTQADMETFMHKDRQQIRDDLADLAGKRLVCAVESQEGRRLNENLIKQVTGGTDELKARFLFEKFFAFRPQFKLFLGTNHKPVIRDTDNAIWERIHLLSFEVQIPPLERVKTLDETLLTELPGIIAWAVQGALEWQRLGDLKPPKRVTTATTKYQEEMDKVGRFLAEECFLGTAATGSPYTTTVRVLHRAYQQWSGDMTLPASTFRKVLEDKKYHSRRLEAGYSWIGIGLPGSYGEKEDK